MPGPTAGVSGESDQDPVAVVGMPYGAHGARVLAQKVMGSSSGGLTAAVPFRGAAERVGSPGQPDCP
jgi:hypothetical protein